MTYYVNRKAQSNGDHEVHAENCPFLPTANNLDELGWFSDCAPAVRASKTSYPTANGCYHCARECHTT